MSVHTSFDADASSAIRVTFKVVRAFKALDDGQRRKWILVVRLQDLPTNLPLDANARIPNVIKNRTCTEMRATLLTQPELFQVFNGGIVCTADSMEVKQVESATFAEIIFDQNGGQGIVNGGHSYAAALHVAHNVTTFSDDRDLIAVLADDLKRRSPDVSSLVKCLVESQDLLVERLSRARQQACVQIEVVAPIPDAELLAQVARARNLSQGVEATSLANLAGKFDHLKATLASAFGAELTRRVIWKQNQKPPENSRQIEVNLLIYLLGLVNFRTYAPPLRRANEVFTRPGMIIRDYVEAEGEQEQFLKKLERALPALLELYDHIYKSIAESDLQYPWSTGKLNDDVRHRASFTPIFADPCPSKVDRAFVWPLFSAFRQLLIEHEKTGEIMFVADPIALFDEKRQELIESIKSFHQHQAHGILQQVGRDKELWVLLDSVVQMELKWRRREGSLGAPLPCLTRRKPSPSDEDADNRANEMPETESGGFTRQKPTSLRFRGQTLSVKSWKDVYTTSAALLAQMYPTQFETRAQELRGKSRPYFSRYRNGMHAPQLISGTKLFMETCFSANDTVRRTKELFAHFDHLEGEWAIESE